MRCRLMCAVFSRPTTMTMLRWRWRRWRETWQRRDWSTSTRLMMPVRMTYHWCIHLILTRCHVCSLLDSCVAQWLKWLKVVQAATTAGLRLLYIAVFLVAVFLVLTLTGQYWPRLWTWMTRLGQKLMFLNCSGNVWVIFMMLPELLLEVRNFTNTKNMCMNIDLSVQVSSCTCHFTLSLPLWVSVLCVAVLSALGSEWVCWQISSRPRCSWLWVSVLGVAVLCALLLNCF